MTATAATTAAATATTDLDGHDEGRAHRPLLVELGIVDGASIRRFHNARAEEGVALDKLVHPLGEKVAGWGGYQNGTDQAWQCFCDFFSVCMNLSGSVTTYLPLLTYLRSFGESRPVLTEADRKAGAGHANDLEHSRVPELLGDAHVVELGRDQLIVRLDAPER